MRLLYVRRENLSAEVPPSASQLKKFERVRDIPSVYMVGISKCSLGRRGSQVGQMCTCPCGGRVDSQYDL